MTEEALSKANSSVRPVLLLGRRECDQGAQYHGRAIMAPRAWVGPPLARLATPLPQCADNGHSAGRGSVAVAAFPQKAPCSQLIDESR